MGLGDMDPDEFPNIWRQSRLEKRSDGLAQTATMRPESQEQLVGESNRDVLSALPDIGQEASESTMPAIDIKGMIGEGGMAQVHTAEQVPLGRDVAVKILREGKGEALSLLQEAWVTGRLEHPNIVPVYRLGRDDFDEPVLVMKQIEGVPWSDLLDDPSLAPREIDADDPLDWHLDILIDVCEAVHYAHNQQIIHRDLKPANVMIGAFGEVYVLDWGLAVSLEDAPDGNLPSASQLHTPAGTPGYMAPEMLTGVGDPLSPQTDIYLLGAILHHIITGEPPHDGERMYDVFKKAYDSDPFDYGSDVPDQLAEIARRAMARKPADRYESADALRRALAQFKRERESYRLSDSARERLVELTRLVEADGGASEQIQKVFGECRFGFEKALEVSDANAAASRGLQEAIEVMIDYQIEREGYEAASLLLSDLPEPRPELDQRVEALGERLASREEEFEQLKDFRRESDVELGRNARSLTALALGILWAGLGYTPVAARRWFDLQLGYGAYLAQGVIVTVVLGTILYIGRRRLFQNDANRRIIRALLLVFGCEWLTRWAMQTVGLEMAATMSVEMMMSGMAVGLLAVTIDRRIGWATPPYLLAGLLAVRAPEWIYELNGLANLVGMGAVALAWWNWGDEPSPQEGS